MNTYDQVIYANRPYSQTHPGHLAVLARLHGVEAPEVETARVLDIGASEGGNIIPMAVTLPRAEFTGIDLARVPVERGNQTVRDLGLKNVRLMEMNLLDVDEAFGQFDYIVAHGLYAWTPEVVRDKLLAVIRANLSPKGVAFVSYNTYPGGYVRRILRDLMLEWIGDATDPAVKLQRAREALERVAAGRPEADKFDVALAQEAKEVRERADSSLFHDYLADIYEPVYFRDFVSHAARHELDYVADAAVLDAWNPRLAESSVDHVAHEAGGDRIRREQMLDHLRLRRFRQSVLCHRAARPSAEEQSSGLLGLWVSSAVRETGEGKFTSLQEITVTTRHPGVVALLRRLSAMWPRAERIEADAELIFEMFKRGMVEVRGWPGVAAQAGNRPEVSTYARYQARGGQPSVSTLDHRSIAITDRSARDFLVLLDGTRERGELASAMGSTSAEIDVRLETLSRYGLMLR